MDEESKVEQALTLDADHHPIDAIQRAAYRMSDRATVEIKNDGPNVTCLIRTNPHGHAGIVDDFRVAVIDEVLRARIRLETQGERNLILALAFSAVAETQT